MSSFAGELLLELVLLSVLVRLLFEMSCHMRWSGGVPARHIRYRFDAIVIEELLASQWWLYDLTSLGPDPVDYADVQGVLNRLKILSDSGNLKVLNPIKQTIGSRMDVAAGKEI